MENSYQVCGRCGYWDDSEDTEQNRCGYAYCLKHKVIKFHTDTCPDLKEK